LKLIEKQALPNALRANALVTAPLTAPTRLDALNALVNIKPTYVRKLLNKIQRVATVVVATRLTIKTAPTLPKQQALNKSKFLC